MQRFIFDHAFHRLQIDPQVIRIEDAAVNRPGDMRMLDANDIRPTGIWTHS